MKNEPRVLFFDVETTYLLSRVWRCGDQVIRHDQLVPGYDATDIICIAYAWNDSKPAKVIGWGYNEQDSESVISKFDKIVAQADYVVGKGSDRFDIKHINTQRLLHDLPPMPQWAEYTDDLEKQLKKYFKFPSHALDAVAKQLGYGGKTPMKMQHWIDIVEKTSRASYRHMLSYCKHDVELTRGIWNRIAKHVKPKFNLTTYLGENVCNHCGSKNLRKDGVRYKGKSKYQEWHCKDHQGYAGRTVINNPDKPGKMTL